MDALGTGHWILAAQSSSSTSDCCCCCCCSCWSIGRPAAWLNRRWSWVRNAITTSSNGIVEAGTTCSGCSPLPRPRPHATDVLCAHCVYIPIFAHPYLPTERGWNVFFFRGNGHFSGRNAHIVVRLCIKVQRKKNEEEWMSNRQLLWCLDGAGSQPASTTLTLSIWDGTQIRITNVDLWFGGGS